MKRFGCACAALCVLIFAKGPERTLFAAEVALNGHTFTLPEGFEIELIAGSPLVDRPITADFDEQGRLYVGDSSGSNDKIQIQLEQKPHRIVRLEDTDGDGKFDKSTVFADRMMFPEGTMWYDGSLYVAAPPSIWKLTDTDGDGVADERSEWFQGKTLTGCANDLHGPYLGPDGWIYWAKGAFAEQTYERPGRSPLVTKASHIFRCRPDGTGIEPVMTGGMDNPVDVVFTPGGERIFTTTFLQHPAGGRRDGLLHAVYGGVYGKVHDVIENHPRTSPDVMPVLTHLGPAAPCGLTNYESDVFGRDYQYNIFAALFNLQKVTRHVLEPSGATFTTIDQDFVVSDNRDFHPTDVLADADGSLVVVDTGGWYKLCCPTSQLHKPDVLGAIYRIRRKDAPRPDDPRGLKLAWQTMSSDELAGLLGDARPAVRQRAMQMLAKQGSKVLPAIETAYQNHRQNSGATLRRHAIWTATRIDDSQARRFVRSALGDSDETVRHVALHSVSLWRDREARNELVRLLESPSVANRRAAAEALGRIGDATAIPPILDAVRQTDDTFLLHSLTFALIEIADANSLHDALQSDDARVRRAALIALDQMEGNRLNVEAVSAELTSADPTLRETALWIASRHPEWGEQLSGYLARRLSSGKLSKEEESELEQQLARFARTPTIQRLLADRLTAESASDSERRLVLRAMAQANLRDVPTLWLGALSRALNSDDEALRAQTVSTARALPLKPQTIGELSAALLEIAGDEHVPTQVRVEALAAIPGSTPLTPDLLSLLQSQLDPNAPVSTRLMAADVLSRARLKTDQLLQLADSLAMAGPLELDRLLSAFERSTDDAVGRKLIAGLSTSPGRSALRVDSLRTRLAKYGPAVQQQAEQLYAALAAEAADQHGRLDELLKSLQSGDIRRGQAVFNSQKAACASCHAIGYLGGKIGPDLTRIGQIRNERDLLEAILFPSASFVRSYEPVLIATQQGQVVNGLIRSETPEEIILITGANQETRIPREEIDEMQPGTLSIMPAGLDRQLTPQELADLVAFLKACR